MSSIFKLPAGYVLTVTAQPGARVHVQSVENAADAALVAFTRTFGPYLIEQQFVVSEGAEVSMAAAFVSVSLPGLFTVSDGTPEDAARASATVAPSGTNNDLVFTAVPYGAGGNEISVRYVDPGAGSQSLAVSVAGYAVTVSLATNSGGTITSTAAQVSAAIAASVEASRLVTVANAGGNDGTGVVTAMAAASLSGGAGTGVGIALPGCLCVDIDAGLIYRNSGTQAAPSWTALADVTP